MKQLVPDYLFIDSAHESPECFAFGGGRAVVYSQRAPFKVTPNEDTAALLYAGDDSGVIVVADGCGGMAHGEIAARLAVEALQEQVRLTSAAGPTLRSAILDGMESANRAVCELSSSAATTMAVVEIDGSMMRTYHVGDSTILVTGSRGRVKMMTTDHSPVGYAVQAGVLDEHEAIYHADRHLVSNVIGCPDAHIEVGARRKLSARDTVVVGTDGLFDNVRISEIVELIRKGPLAQCAEQLAALANRRMLDAEPDEPSKPDDLTFVLFRPCS